MVRVKIDTIIFAQYLKRRSAKSTGRLFCVRDEKRCGEMIEMKGQIRIK